MKDNNSKRVVIIADALDLQYAGIRNYLLGLIESLQDLDTQHEYILLRANQDFRKYANEVFVKSSVSRLVHPKSRLLVEIPRAIKKLSPDVVVEPAHFGPFRIDDRIKKITFIHDLTPITHPHYHPRNSTLLHKLLLPGVLKRANLIITPSKHTRSRMNEMWPYTNGKTEVIYPGTTSYDSQEVPRLDRIDITKDPYILNVGTLEPRKNHHFLLDVFEAVKPEWPALKLVLCGKMGWKSRSLKQALMHHPYQDDIIQTGYIHDRYMSQLYSQARALLFTSHYEGFGLPFLEAMTQGCPILTSDNSTQREVCKDAAIYLDIDQVGDWKRFLLALRDDSTLSVTLRDKGRARATRFSWERSAVAFDNHITELFAYDVRS